MLRRPPSRHSIIHKSNVEINCFWFAAFARSDIILPIIVLFWVPEGGDLWRVDGPAFSMVTKRTPTGNDYGISPPPSPLHQLPPPHPQPIVSQAFWLSGFLANLLHMRLYHGHDSLKATPNETDQGGDSQPPPLILRLWRGGGEPVGF